MTRHILIFIINNYEIYYEIYIHDNIILSQIINQ